MKTVGYADCVQEDLCRHDGNYKWRHKALHHFDMAS